MQQGGEIVIRDIVNADRASVPVCDMTPLGASRKPPRLFYHCFICCGSTSLGEFLPQCVTGVPVSGVECRIVTHGFDKAQLLRKLFVLALVGVIFVHAGDFRLHQDTAHLSGVTLGFGGFIRFTAHGVIHRVADVLLLGIFQRGLPSTNRSIGLLHFLTAVAVEPFLLRFKALHTRLVVSFAHGVVEFLLQALDGGCDTAEGLGLGFH